MHTRLVRYVTTRAPPAPTGRPEFAGRCAVLCKQVKYNVLDRANKAATTSGLSGH
jgi:hypothetical protein